MMEEMRLAVVGVMGKGRQHARQVGQLQGARLCAVADRNPDAAEIARELKVPFFADIESLIRSGAADAIICAVPHPVHRQVEVPCLEAGLHVLSEKPLAATPSDAKAIVDAARRTGRVLGMMFQYRQRPAVKKAKELLDAGAIGPWYYAVMHHAINRTQAYYDARPWRGTWEGEGGGVLVNQAPHPVETLMHLLGAFPRRVVAMNNRLRHRMQTEDIATAILEFDGGAQAALHADTIGLPPSEWWAIWGDRGNLRMEDRQVVLRQIDPDVPGAIASGHATTEPVPVEVTQRVFDETGPDSKHLGMMQDFVDAVCQGRQPMVGGPWALKCVELHAALILSAATGRAVDFPPDYDEYDALIERLRVG